MSYFAPAEALPLGKKKWAATAAECQSAENQYLMQIFPLFAIILCMKSIAFSLKKQCSFGREAMLCSRKSNAPFKE